MKDSDRNTYTHGHEALLIECVRLILFSPELCSFSCLCHLICLYRFPCPTHPHTDIPAANVILHDFSSTSGYNQGIILQTKNVCLLPTNTRTCMHARIHPLGTPSSDFLLELCSIWCLTWLEMTVGKHFMATSCPPAPPLLTSVLLSLPPSLKTAVSSKCPALLYIYFFWKPRNSVARCCILDTADWTRLIIGRQFNFLGIKGDLLGFELVPVGVI